MITTAQKFKVIDRDALKAMIDKKEKFHLWNVLTKEYYKPEANIPGSKWIPVDTLTEKVANAMSKKNDAIVTYCGGGDCPSSKQAAEKLVSLGFTDVSAFEGGLKSWTEAKLPLIKL
jgi:rhodanese-related sulfurtransferase